MLRCPNFSLAGAVLAGALASLAWSRAANATNYIAHCANDPVEYDNGQLFETRNKCGIPDGSLKEVAYRRAIDRWHVASNLGVIAKYARSGCSGVNVDDWNNEVSTTDRSNIGGANGLTYYAHENVCFLPPGPGDYGASDILLAPDLGWTDAEPWQLLKEFNGAYGEGAGVLVHEMGHQQGLDENSIGSMMSVQTPWANFTGGPGPLSDDISGVRLLYGTRAHTELVPTNHRWVSSQRKFVYNTDFALQICRSATHTNTLAVLNPSSSSLTFTHRVRYNESETDPSATLVRQITFRDVTMGAASTRVVSYSTEIAPYMTKLHKYHIWHQVDVGNTIAEADDENNWLWLGSILIKDC